MRRAVLFLLLAALALPAWAGEGDWILGDGILARVDREAVTLTEARLEAKIAEREGRYRSVEAAGLDLVKRRLFVAEAEKLRFQNTPEEVDAAVAELAAKGGGESLDAWFARVGVTRTDIERRAGEILLMRRFLALRRETTYVSESQVRLFYAENAEVLGDRPLSEIHDTIQAYLTSKRFRTDLDAWIEKQVALGRILLDRLAEAPTL